MSSAESVDDPDHARLEKPARALAEDKTRSLLRRAMLPPIADLSVEVLGLALVVAGFFHAGNATYLDDLAGRRLASARDFVRRQIFDREGLTAANTASAGAAHRREDGRKTAAR